MTRHDAFVAMIAGKKMTHRNFTRDEYCHMPHPNNHTVVGEDGCDLTHHFHTTDFLSEGWREFK